MDSGVYLMAFESLTDVNAVKRAYRTAFLPMRRTPAGLARAGCGFALTLEAERVDDVCEAASRAGVTVRLYRVEPSADGPNRYVAVGGGSP